MGTAVYPVLEHEIDGLDPFVSGKALASAMEALDSLARRIGVQPLMGFFSINPGEAAVVLGTKERIDVAGPTEEWFAAVDGLKTVKGLTRCLRAESVAIGNAEAVILDLEEFSRVLRQAARHNIRWHLSVDF